MNWGWLNAPVSLNLSIGLLIGLLLFIISGSCFIFAWRTGRQADGRYGTKWARRFCIWGACLGIICCSSLASSFALYMGISAGAVIASMAWLRAWNAG
jgi:hypothetical protein